MKKTKYLIIAIITVIAAINFSCNNVNSPKNITKLDSLQTMLVNTQNVFKQADSNEIAAYSSRIATQMKNFRAAIGDSIDKKSGEIFMRYFSLNDVFTSFLKAYPTLKKDIQYSTNQIDNLEKDVKEGNMDQKKFDEYFAKEQSAIIQLSSNVDKDMNSILTAVKMYEMQNKTVAMRFDSLIKLRNGN